MDDGNGRDGEVREAILRSCQTLFAPGQVAELRILGIGGREGKNAAGWYDDHNALADAVLQYEHANAEGMYVTMNPLKRGCLARAHNRIVEWRKKTSGDNDVEQRFWILIDVDYANRPSGVSATDSEIAAARAVARDIRDSLEQGRHWPPGIRAFSGNGIHLLYRIALPNNDESKTLVSECLAALDQQFSTSEVHVDRANINASRIVKLWGTVARKGDNTPDRPHRRSQLWATTSEGTVPAFGEFGVVTREMLADLAGTFGRPSASATTPAPKKPRTKKDPPMPGTKLFDLERFIDEASLKVVRHEAWDGGARYILECCPFDSSHTGTSASLGRTKAGAIFFKCQHESCVDRNWQAVKALFPDASNKTSASSAPSAKVRAKAASGDGDPWEFAKLILKEYFTDPNTGKIGLRQHRESFYAYDPDRKAYIAITNNTMKNTVTRWLGENADKATLRKVSDTTNCLAAFVAVPDELDLPLVSPINEKSGYATATKSQHNRIGLNNGILNLDEILSGKPIGEALSPCTPEWFSTSALPFPFPTTETETKCDRWMAFLNEVMQGDESRIKLIQEAFGYSFFPDPFLEAFFVFHGAGRNGKSTVLSILYEMLGGENVSSLSPEQLSDKVMVHSLYGKLANICSDLNQLDRVEEGIIKAIVSGDPIMSDIKYKTPVMFRPTATLFFSTNVLPRFADTSIGIWRRMVLVPFDYVVPPEKIDVNLLAKLKEEMPGIIYWSLQGMVRLKQRQRFTKSVRSTAATYEYRRQCFPILMFLAECTELQGKVAEEDQEAPPFTTQIHELWRLYRQWCSTFGLQKPKPMHQFAKDVLSFRPTVTHNRVSAGLEGRMNLYGLRIRPGVNLDELADPNSKNAPIYRGSELHTGVQGMI